MLFVFHLGMVVAYICPWPEQTRLIQPISIQWVEVTNLDQHWNMFRNPARWDGDIVHTGVLEDGSEIDLQPSTSAETRDTVAGEREPTRYRQHYAA